MFPDTHAIVIDRPSPNTRGHRASICKGRPLVEIQQVVLKRGISCQNYAFYERHRCLIRPVVFGKCIRDLLICTRHARVQCQCLSGSAQRLHCVAQPDIIGSQELVQVGVGGGSGTLNLHGQEGR